MRCQKAKEYVSRELDALLPPDATGKLRDHLDACSDCREFREDLLLGQRLLAATEPRLPDNFDWKLQLRLNQALQRTAGEERYPWQTPQADRWVWRRNFGAATAVGLAAVLALAMFFGPVEATRLERPVAVNASDRLPLFQPGSGGLYRTGTQQQVSAGGRTLPGAAYLDRGWSGSNTEDLKTIRRLRVENQRLTNMLLQNQLQNEMIRAQLDTGATKALDLQHNH